MYPLGPMISARLLACLLSLVPIVACKAKVESTAPLFKRTISTADAPAETLSLSVHYSFAADGTYTRVMRHRYRLLTQAGVQSWGTISEMWEPWFQERPELTATVTTPDGGKVTLDPATVSAGPAQSYSDDVFSDAQVVRAPLPALTVGAEVDEVVTVRSSKPLPWAAVHAELLQGPIKRGLREVVIEAPANLKIHYLVEGSTQRAEDVVVGGRRRVTWSAKDLPGLEFPEASLPSDVQYWPRLIFRVHDQAWRDVARDYSEFVDAALKGFKPPAAAQAIIDAKASREQKIEALLEWVHDRVRYSGLELGTGTVIPNPPATVLGRGYGDCKDKATMLVGLLRAAGVEAHVALLRAGSGVDITTTFPGLSEFNHAIVYVPGREPLWIDATATYSRMDQLPGADRGRMALIAARDSQAPVMTPRARADDNTYTEIRTVTLAPFGKGSVHEEITATGEQELRLREAMEGSQKVLEEGLRQYASREYGGAKLKSFEVTPSADVTTKYRFVLDIEKAAIAETELANAAVTIEWGALWTQLPQGIFAAAKGDDDDADDKLRKGPLAVTNPFDARLIYRIKLPPGFEPILPTLTPVDLSPVLLERKVRREGDDVVVELRVRLDGPRMSPEQVNAFREAVERLDKQGAMRVAAVHRASLAYDRKDIAGALAIVAKEAKSGDPIGRLRHADVLGSLHLRDEALAEVRGVIGADASNAYAHAMLGDLLRKDRFGRLRGAGWDRDGAIAASLKAGELEDSLKKGRVSAAGDAESGDNGEQFGLGADLARAAEIWSTVEPEVLAEYSDPKLANNELFVLWQLERYDAIEALVSRRGAEAPKVGKLMLAWRRAGVGAVIEELRKDTSSSAGERAEDLKAIYGAMLVRDSYANLATLAEAASSLGIVDDPSIKMLQTTARTSEKSPAVTASATGPKRLFIDLMDATMQATAEAADRAIERLLSTRVSDKQVVRDSLGWRKQLHYGSSPTLVRFTRDLLLGGSTLTSEGSDALGHRVSWAITLGSMTDKPVHLFVLREGKEYRLRATSSSRSEVVREAATLIAAGKVEAGRKWLTWYFDGLHRTDAHLLMQPPDVVLWADGKGDPALVAKLALAMFDDKEAFKAIVAARATMKDEDPSAAILDHAIVRRASKADVAHSKRALAALRVRFPDAEALAGLELQQAAGAEDWKLADKLYAAYMTRYPRAYGMQRRQAQLLIRRGEHARAIDLLAELQAQGVAEDEDFNNMAWWSLFVGDGVPSEKALEWAVRAGSTNSASGIHTLGCVYAAMGRTLQALEVFDRLVAMKKELDLVDEFLLADIHHQLGYKTEARALFARMAKEEGRPDSTAALAKRRLAAKR